MPLDWSIKHTLSELKVSVMDKVVWAGCYQYVVTDVKDNAYWADNHTLMCDAPFWEKVDA